jgi:serine/threonine protein kinase
MLGTRIGNFTVIKPLGSGGMGAVYLMQHDSIDAKKVIKVLHPEVAANQEAVQRFWQEARSASSIGHRGVVKIYDVGVLQNGQPYLEMEFLQGEPLDELLKRRREAKQPLHPLEVVGIVAEAGSALQAAHDHGIVHRDIKPQNIFVVREHDGESVKVLDFGIAKVVDNHEGPVQTRTGMVLGTVLYMSPEQALGEHVDHRTDIYALGAMTFEMLTGSVPFTVTSFGQLVAQHERYRAQALRFDGMLAERGVPVSLAEAVVRALAYDRNERHHSVAEFVLALAVLPGGMEVVERRAKDLLRRRPPSATTVQHVGPGAPHVGAPPTMPPVAAIDSHPGYSQHGMAWPGPPQGASTYPASTTLGGAAAQSSPRVVHDGRTKPRWPLFAGLGVVVAGGAVAALVVASNGESAPALSTPAASLEAQAAADAQPSPANPNDIRIVSDPPGASVSVDGVTKGTSPLTLSLEPGQRVVIRGELDGHRADEETLAVKSEPQTVHLLLPIVPVDAGVVDAAVAKSDDSPSSRHRRRDPSSSKSADTQSKDTKPDAKKKGSGFDPNDIAQ